MGSPRPKTPIPPVRPKPFNKDRKGRATGRAGGYAAPVDTTGMDKEMRETLKIKRTRKGSR